MGAAWWQLVNRPLEGQDENQTQEAVESGHVHLLFAWLQDLWRTRLHGKVVQEKVWQQKVKQKQVQDLQGIRQSAQQHGRQAASSSEWKFWSPIGQNLEYFHLKSFRLRTRSCLHLTAMWTFGQKPCDFWWIV